MRYTPFLTLALLAAPTILQAQDHAVDRGVFIIGGHAGFSSTGGDPFTERTVTISGSPSLEYFVASHLAVGGTVSLAHANVGAGLPSITRLGVGPKVSYYFGGAEAAVHPFLAASVSLARTTFGESEAPNPRIPAETFVSFRLAGGGAFMVAKNVALIGEAFYRLDARDVDDGPESLDINAFGLDFGVQVFVF